MIYCCEDCGFLFQRVGEIHECPSCEGSRLRSATQTEAEKLRSLLKIIEEKRKKTNEKKKLEYIWYYAKSPSVAEVSFSDVKAGTGTAKAVSWAVGYGVTNCTGGTTFSPNSTCTRGQIVTFLHRYFVEPLETAPAPVPVAPTDPMKLDPLPPEDYRKHPDWYLSLTPAYEMSNARLVAESDQIGALIKEYRANDDYIIDSMLVRKDDLMYEIMARRTIISIYDEYVKWGRPVPDDV